MTCAVAVASSPVFSPSSRVSSFYCKSSLSSPETLTLNHHHGSSSPCSSSGISTSQLMARLQRSQTGFRVLKKDGYAVGGAESGSSSPTLLKRKRPARIDIPVAAMNFAVAKMPVAAEEVAVEKEGFSVYCKKGRREAMEDRYSAVVNLQGDPKQAFFGVFDGHGGAKAAEFAAANMDKNIMDEVRRRGDEEIEEAVEHGYQMTDSEFLKEDVHGGTCCVTALIRKGDLVVSNAGDCRAVMSRGGIAEALTSDHRPSRKDERERIETLGGFVDCRHGVWRLQGSLAVSRGIGDQHLKQWVIAEPETKVLKIKSDCDFLILASDGLWDKVTNQEAVDIVQPLCLGTEKPAPLSACKKLAEVASFRGSADDISVMVIQLGNFI